MKNIQFTVKFIIMAIVECAHLLTVEGMPNIQANSVIINSTKACYPTIQEAVDNANNNDILTLLKNMDINEEIRIAGKSITIQPAGYITLLRGYHYDGNLFNIEKDASLTLRTNLLQIDSPDPKLAGTDLLDEKSRLVIDGDWKSQFIVGDDGQDIHIDANGKCYVTCKDGKKLYLDEKRHLILEKSREDVFVDIKETQDGSKVFKQYISPVGNARKLFLDTAYYKENNNAERIVVERQVDGCIIANYGYCVINGDVIICNNYNYFQYFDSDPFMIHVAYNQNIPYGAIYNNGIFDIIIGYICDNAVSGVFNVKKAIFNMYNGKIFKNLAYHGGGALNYGTFNMYGGEISFNKAYRYGAGFCNERNFNMLNGTVSDNKTDFCHDNVGFAPAYGGAAYNDITGKLIIKKGKIERNYSREGGAIYNRGNLQMTNCSVTKNGALTLLYSKLNGESLNIIEQRFDSNHTPDIGRGGGVFNDSGQLHISRNTSIMNNISYYGQDVFDSMARTTNCWLALKRYFHETFFSNKRHHLNLEDFKYLCDYDNIRYVESSL